MKLQFWVGLFGGIGLIITLFFSALSARAAGAAAKASIDAVHLSGRGFLGVKKFTFHRATWATDTEPEVKGFFIVPTISNAGTAPAIAKGSVVSTRVIERGDTSPVDWEDNIALPKLHIFVGPSTEFTENHLILNLLSLSKIYRGELRVLYMFKHYYKDMFHPDATYHTHSCFELMVYGDPEAIFKDEALSPSQYMVMEARGEYGSAS